MVGVLVDDVLDLAAARADRAGHGAAVGAGHRADREAVAEACSSRSGRRTGTLNAQIEEAFTGHALVKVFGRQREVRGGLRRARTTSCTRPLRRAVRLRHDHAGDDVRREPQLRRDRRGRRPAGRVRRDDPRRRAGVHPVLAPVHPAADPARLDGATSCSPASRRPSGCSSCSTPRREPDPRAAEPRRAGAARRAGRVRGRVVPLRPRKPLIEDLSLVRGARPDGRDRRPDRRRQDHAREPDHAVLRARRGPDHARRRRHRADDAATTCAAASAWCCRTPGCSAARSARTSPTAARRHRGRDPRAGRGDLRRPVRAHAARRLRHRDRRGGQQPQRRREAADHDRPRVPRRAVDPDPRRGHQLGRHPHRGAGPARDGRAADATARAS